MRVEFKKFIKHLIMLILLMVMTSSFVEEANAFSFSDAMKGKLSQDKIHRVKNNIENQRARTKNKIKELRIKEKKEIKKLYKTQSNLENTRKELQVTQQNFNQTKDRLNQLEYNLNSANRQFVQSQSEVSKRLKDIYKGEKISFLKVLLDSKDINALLDRVHYQTIIAKKDTKSLHELKVRAEKYISYKEEVERQKNNLLYSISKINTKKDRLAQDIYTSQYMINKLRTDRETYEESEKELSKQSSRLASMLQRGVSKRGHFKTVTGFVRPIRGGITSPFGWRRHPIFGSRTFHAGVDIGGPSGGSVRAANSGIVIFSGWYGGYGKVVILDHGNYKGVPTSTLYAHLSSYSVGRNAKVSKGQVIGREGSTGYSTGPHLHFEVRVNGNPTNPLGYIN